MLTEYGHAKVRWQGKDYTLSPSLINISKLGSPKEIIDDFKQFVEASVIWKFIIATRVIDACSDIEIPDELLGSVKYSENKNKFLYVQPPHGLPMMNDAIVLGEHLLLHGVCGKSEKPNKSGDPITEFDPYKIMEVARIHLGLDAQESSRMTMTEFVRMMQVKFPPEEDDKPDSELDSKLLDWFNNENEVH